MRSYGRLLLPRWRPLRCSTARTLAGCGHLAGSAGEAPAPTGALRRRTLRADSRRSLPYMVRDQLADIVEIFDTIVPQPLEVEQEIEVANTFLFSSTLSTAGPAVVD